MDVSLRRVIKVLDTYTDNKKHKDHGVHIKFNVNELQYMLNVVKTFHSSHQPTSCKIREHNDVLSDLTKRDLSKLKMKSKNRDRILPEISQLMLPSIQSAVDHFRKIMSKPKGSSVQFPSLSRSFDSIHNSSRIKYKHRSSEELTKNSENWDRLKDILQEETNSIDVVYAANKPEKTHMESLECSPPLVPLSLSTGINLDKEKDLELKSRQQESTKDDLKDEVLKNDVKIEKNHPSGKNIADPDGKCEKNNASDSKMKGAKLPPKALLVSIPTEEDKSAKKKVRFNLDLDIHRKTYVSALKASRAKDKKHSLTQSFKFSYFNHTNETSKKAKVRSEMKQIFRGQHPDKFYRSQR